MVGLPGGCSAAAVLPPPLACRAGNRVGLASHRSMSWIWDRTICRAPMKMIQGVCENVQGLSASALVVSLKW